MALRVAGTGGDGFTHGQVLVLARDPRVIATAQDAAQRVSRAVAVLESDRQALTLLTAPGRADHQVICDPAVSKAACWPDLVAAAAEQRGLTALLMVSDKAVCCLPRGMQLVPNDAALMAAALRTGASAYRGEVPEAAVLRSGLGKGDIVVRYQPMIRIADRRLMVVEALARWMPGYPPVGPDIFVPLAERAGLMRPLSMAVARAAITEIGPLRQRMRLGVTVNLPLDLLRQRDLTAWLGQMRLHSPMRPQDIAIELTEHAEVHDRGALDQALRRLRHAGHAVYLDDVLLNDPRARLLDLPFSGLKLDRSFVAALPSQARARQALRRMVRGARAKGQLIVAEGVSHPLQLRLLGELGVDWAQGFLISRPLPVNALASWSELWRAGRPL